MRPPSTLRKWQFDQLQREVPIVQFIIETVPKETLITKREKPEGWTVAEVLGHLLDCERLFVQRAHLTVEQDCPELPFPNQDEDVKKGHYNERDPHTILNEWKMTREEYVTYLTPLLDEVWKREGRHPQYAPFSLDDQLALACRHTILHIEQMTRILACKE